MQKDKTKKVPKDVILHKRVRQFLKSQALKMLMTKALTDEDQKVMQLCVSEAEYHERLDRGQLYDKEKFILMISQSYGWEPSSRTARGRPRKGGSKPGKGSTNKAGDVSGLE